MNETATTWSTWHEAVSVIAAPRQLKKTASVALIVGSAFFAMNQLSVIVAGQAAAIVWLKAALTYLTPLLVSSFGVLSATRQSAASSPSPEHPASPAALRLPGRPSSEDGGGRTTLMRPSHARPERKPRWTRQG